MTEQLFTHAHDGNFMPYLASQGCDFQYTEERPCPSCGLAHRCGDNCNV